MDIAEPVGQIFKHYTKMKRVDSKPVLTKGTRSNQPDKMYTTVQCTAEWRLCCWAAAALQHCRLGHWPGSRCDSIVSPISSCPISLPIVPSAHPSSPSSMKYTYFFRVPTRPRHCCCVQSWCTSTHHLHLSISPLSVRGAVEPFPVNIIFAATTHGR